MPAVTLDIPGSKQETKYEINQHIMHLWNTRWKRLNSCRQTKIFFPELSASKSDQLLKNSRGMYSTLVQWLTGHTFLNRHEFIVGNLDFNECRFCGLEPETSSHLITDCEVLWPERVDCFKDYFLDKSNPQWKAHDLVKFLQKPAIRALDTAIYPE